MNKIYINHTDTTVKSEGYTSSGLYVYVEGSYSRASLFTNAPS